MWLLVRRATDSERVAHLAVVLYLITDWVGQNYFAAQTLATLLSLSVLGLSMSWFSVVTTRSLPWLRVVDQPSRTARAVVPSTACSRPARRAVVLRGVSRADDDRTRSHRSPTAGALVARVGDRLDPRHQTDRRHRRWSTVAWGLRSYAYFVAQSFDLGFGGSPTDNADGNLDYSAAPDAVVAVGNLTRLFSVGGMVRWPWSGHCCVRGRCVAPAR